NAPFGADASESERRAWVAELDRIHEPLIQPHVGMIHYGALPAARAFTGLALLQGVMFLCLALLAGWAMRERVSAARDRLWVAMARESAHQLGTTLTSLTGWSEYPGADARTPGRELSHGLTDAAQRVDPARSRLR